MSCEYQYQEPPVDPSDYYEAPNCSQCDDYWGRLEKSKAWLEKTLTALYADEINTSEIERCLDELAFQLDCDIVKKDLNIQSKKKRIKTATLELAELLTREVTK